MVLCMWAVKSVMFLADFYVVFLRGPVLLIYILIGGKGFGRGRYKFCCCCHNLPSCQRYEISATRYYISVPALTCHPARDMRFLLHTIIFLVLPKHAILPIYEILTTCYYISGPPITCHPARDMRFLLHAIIFLVLPLPAILPEI